MFRQAFLLIQYSFICLQYFKCSDTIYTIFFDSSYTKSSWLFQQTLFLFFGGEKIKNNSMFEKVLLVCNRNAELLRLIGATIDSKVASLKSMRKKNLIILKSLQKKSLPFFVVFICRCWHLSSQISIGSVRKIVICSLNVLITLLYLKLVSIL